MKHSRSVFIPAAIAVLASLALILYAYFGEFHQGAPVGMRRGEESGTGLFKTLGTVAVWCGAVSYTWLRLKKKRKSPSALAKKLVKLFDRLHQPAGYAALALIAAHGVYFLTQSAIKGDTYTGIAAFTLLLSLAVYGVLIRRVRNKHIRKIHFLLASAFAVVAFVHAGGSVILAAAGTIVLWALVGLLERAAAQPG